LSRVRSCGRHLDLESCDPIGNDISTGCGRSVALIGGLLLVLLLCHQVLHLNLLVIVAVARIGVGLAVSLGLCLAIETAKKRTSTPC
jgi:hypothetical protein